MIILGLNAFHGDASAAALVDGQLEAAIEEERFNRIKHWAGLPIESAKAVLDGATPDHIAVSRDPRAQVWRKLLRAASQPGQWRRFRSRASNSVRVSDFAEELARPGGIDVGSATIHHVEHHRAHLASAFFCSPFEEAAVISIDGFGDFSSLMWATGRDNQLDVRGAVHFPHSLGIFYTAFTQFLGFLNYGDEYKMMGLAAYGEPRFAAKVRDVVKVEGDQIRLNLDYFLHHDQGVEMSWDNCSPQVGRVYSDHLVSAFGAPRERSEELTAFHMDLACSVQTVLEECYFAILNYVQRQTGLKAVCLAGGVALNCVANGMIFERTAFRDVYIQPAAHDAGTSIGAALYVQHQTLGQPRSFVMQHVYYGPEHTDATIRTQLAEADCTVHRLSEDELIRRTAAQIADGNVVGWYQGRSEFGPRALGNRSILADPRRAGMKDTLNLRIKHREPFRPFCPSILAERTGEYFETDYPSPFMVQAYKIKPDRRDQIPAVTHNDGTGRLQTVEQSVNPLYWKLLAEFDRIAGVPVLINTSFNENEPIVNSPAQAIDCFLRTRMDALAIGSFLVLKTENTALSEGRIALSGRVN